MLLRVGTAAKKQVEEEAAAAAKDTEKEAAAAAAAAAGIGMVRRLLQTQGGARMAIGCLICWNIGIAHQLPHLPTHTHRVA